uniref:Uncharacterized protein n=1 Tax=Parascaris univalens TaxID=6257 RepID=A0A914ZMA4_PARUN
IITLMDANFPYIYYKMTTISLKNSSKREEAILHFLRGKRQGYADGYNHSILRNSFNSGRYNQDFSYISKESQATTHNFQHICQERISTIKINKSRTHSRRITAQITANKGQKLKPSIFFCLTPVPRTY